MTSPLVDVGKYPITRGALIALCLMRPNHVVSEAHVVSECSVTQAAFVAVDLEGGLNVEF